MKPCALHASTMEQMRCLSRNQMKRLNQVVRSCQAVAAWRLRKIFDEQKLFILEWHCRRPKFSATQLAQILIVHLHKDSIRSASGFLIFFTSVYLILHEGMYGIKTSRACHPVIITESTSKAIVCYVQAHERLAEKSCGSENLTLTIF